MGLGGTAAQLLRHSGGGAKRARRLPANSQLMKRGSMQGPTEDDWSLKSGGGVRRRLGRRPGSRLRCRQRMASTPAQQQGTA